MEANQKKAIHRAFMRDPSLGKTRRLQKKANTKRLVGKSQAETKKDFKENILFLIQEKAKTKP